MFKIIILAIFVGFIGLIISLAWPFVGLLFYMGIYLAKPLLVMRIPFLTGLWGYVVDLGFVFIALLAILKSNYAGKEIEGRLVSPAVYACLLFLVVWTWFRLPATRNMELGKTKVLIFTIFDMLVIFMGINYGRTMKGVREIIKAMIFMGLFAIVGILIFGRAQHEEYASSRITFGYSNPLGAADLAAYFMLTVFGLWLAKRTTKLAIITVSVFVCSIAVLIFSGSRGPLFGLAPSLLLMAYYYRKSINFKWLLAVVLFAVVCIFSFNILLKKSGMTGRFGEEGIREAMAPRIYWAKISLAGWAHSPILGNGPGDLSVQGTGMTVLTYPHDVLLEVANELGTVGLVPYLMLLYYASRTRKLFSIPEFENTEYKMISVIIFAGFVYQFILTFKTGSYAGSNMFYFLWGAVIGIGNLGRSEYWRIYENQEQLEQNAAYA